MRVALTGGIGSGKSAVAEILRGMGAQVSESDDVARTMMRSGVPLFSSIVARFGSSVVASSGELDRSVLARLAFQEGRLQELNALVHPAVLEAQDRWMDDVERQDRHAVAIVVSALVLETRVQSVYSGAREPWRARFDRIVVVSAAPATREARYVQRTIAASTVDPTRAKADFQARAAAQWTDAEREQLADVVVHNDGSVVELEAQVSNLYASLRAEASRQGPAAR